ncbi:MAG TPA: hypothetical protein VHT73_09635 [Thermodesulfobacteriota bacterium]|nr:hypothetical protein [Thermodesulfobacteriota bacterium]
MSRKVPSSGSGQSANPRHGKHNRFSECGELGEPYFSVFLYTYYRSLTSTKVSG